jgi:hypothetical protein
MRDSAASSLTAGNIPPLRRTSRRICLDSPVKRASLDPALHLQAASDRLVVVMSKIPKIAGLNVCFDFHSYLLLLVSVLVARAFSFCSHSVMRYSAASSFTAGEIFL